MGLCNGKPTHQSDQNPSSPPSPFPNPSNSHPTKLPLYTPSPLPGFSNSPSPASSTSTPLRFFNRPFPPPSPAKQIRALLARRHGSLKLNGSSVPEGQPGLDKNFGFSKQFGNHYELGDEIGRGHFGYTCSAKGKKGSMKGFEVAVKVIPKSKGCFTCPDFNPFNIFFIVWSA